MDGRDVSGVVARAATEQRIDRGQGDVARASTVSEWLLRLAGSSTRVAGVLVAVASADSTLVEPAARVTLPQSFGRHARRRHELPEHRRRDRDLVAVGWHLDAAHRVVRTVARDERLFVRLAHPEVSRCLRDVAVAGRVDRRDAGRSGGHARQREHDGLPTHPEGLGELSPGPVDGPERSHGPRGRGRPVERGHVERGRGPDRFGRSSAVPLPRRRVRDGELHRVPEPLRGLLAGCPGSSTLWGATADVTQPTIGNHENASTAPFIDYWHQRPLFTSSRSVVSCSSI